MAINPQGDPVDTQANPLQTFCHAPAPAPGFRIRLHEGGFSACPYLPGRMSQSRAFVASEVDPMVYHTLMDRAFRRSGIYFYQMTCPGCRACVPIRMDVRNFVPSKSQRRVRSKNGDLTFSFSSPELTAEKHELYARYVTQKHGKTEPPTFEELQSFLYESPVQTQEFCYRDSTGKLLGVGIVDVCPLSLSSVYFYFDPAHASRSLGTFSALIEIAWAQSNDIPWYYLGFWVKDSLTMDYKNKLGDHALLGTDGIWRHYKKGQSLDGPGG